MATPGGRADPPLEELLFEEPYRFDFFQAVRLLSLMSPDRVRVGADGPPVARSCGSTPLRHWLSPPARSRS